MLGESGKKFVSENAREDERGTYHVTQKAYVGFMNEQGVPKQVLDTIGNAHEELVNGMYLFGDEKLKAKVKAEQKAGHDGKDQKVQMSVNIPNGHIDMLMESSKSYPVPRGNGERIDKANVTHFNMNQKRLLNKDILSECEAEMKKLLKL